MDGITISPGDILRDTETGVDLTFKGSFLGTDTMLFEADYGYVRADIGLEASEVLACYMVGRFREVPGAGNVREVVGKGSEAEG